MQKISVKTTQQKSPAPARRRRRQNDVGAGLYATVDQSTKMADDMLRNNLHIPIQECLYRCSCRVQCCPTRGPHAARRLISCGPPVLAKFARNNILFTQSSKRQNLT